MRLVSSVSALRWRLLTEVVVLLGVGARSTSRPIKAFDGKPIATESRKNKA